MKRLLSFLLFVLLLSTALAGLSVWSDSRDGARPVLSKGVWTGQPYTVAEGPALDLRSVDALAAMSRARVALAKAVVPSVVSVTTSKSIAPQQRRLLQDPILRFFFGGQGGGGGGGGNDEEENGAGGVAERALGSGVIVSREGHILTNNHVVEGFDQIEVKLNDRRTFKARLIGADPATDLAVLKIDAENLPALTIGDSDRVEVGETVMAIGNPYGLEETVTQGIISAKNRVGDGDSLNEFFQIDAAINPGNSGGALVNVGGELIGINSSIYSQTGGFQGVGFAIPANTARYVLDSFLTKGRVVRGFLGVNLRRLAPDEVRRLRLPDPNGALVAAVTPDSPAARAGVKEGDFIRKFNHRAVVDVADLRRNVGNTEVDRTVPLELLRDGKNVTLEVKLVEQPRTGQALSRMPFNRPPRGGGGGSRGGNPPPPAPPSRPLPGGGGGTSNGGGSTDAGASPLAGVEVRNLTPSLARQLVPAGEGGVVVAGVEEDSPAAESLQRGDVITEINQQPVGSARQYQEIVDALGAEDRVILSIVRGRAKSFVVIEPQP